MGDEIICPSGLAGTIRGLKAKEGKLLADRTAVRSGQFLDQLLTSCWLETTNPGIYGLAEGQALDWTKVLVGDRFFVLLRLRAKTFGDRYTFSIQCPSARCREKFEWEVDLGALEIKPLSDEAKAAYKAGNRFQTALPKDGRKIWFRLLTGADEARISRMPRDRDSAFITALAFRIVEIEGIADTEKRKFLDDLELSDATALLDQFDRADGGVETNIEVECPFCYGIQEVQLPFGRNFFLPKAA
jgi:hypothetical protein